VRICISIHHHLDADAGAPGAALALAEALTDLGHRVTTRSFDNLPSSWSERRKMVSYPWSFSCFLWRHALEFDIVDASMGDAWVWSLLRRRGTKPLLTVSSHGLEHLANVTVLREAEAGRLRLSRKYSLYHGGWRLREVAIALGRSEAAFFLNSAELKFAKEKLGLDPSRLFVVHNGLPDDFIGLPPPTANEGHAIRIAQIGRYSHGKGTVWGAAALSAVMAKHPAVSVTFLGTQRSRDIVLADFEGADHGRIRVIENFKRCDLPHLLDGHHIIFLPTLSEGFSLALLEGMACGLAPVSTTARGPSEVVVDGQNGLLVPPADANPLTSALEALITDRPLLARLRRAAYATAQPFSWHSVARQRLDVYERLLGSGT
jgi:glycosyltransferase involved in cell wall biosynthesis